MSLPRLGQGMEAGTIVRWLKSEGDTVEKGEALYELDTDKVTQEVEADAGGVLLKILAGEGEDVTVVATGRLVHESLKAAEQASEEGISVEVFDPRTLQPLDEEAIIDSVKKTNRAVVAHEAVTRMGFGAEVAAVIQHQAFDWLDAPVERVGAKFVPLPFAPVMEEFVVPHQAEVYEAIMLTVGRNGT